MKSQKQSEPEPLGKPLPSDVDAERVVLGAMLLGHSQTSEILQSLAPDDFFDFKHQIIFETMQKMWSESIPIEHVSMCANLISRKKLDDAGGAGYLSDMVMGLPVKTNVDFYTNRVVEKQLNRLIIHTCTVIQQAAFDADEEQIDAGSVIDFATERLAAIRDKAKSLSCGTSNWDAAVELVASLKNTQKHPIECGIPTIDTNTGGFRAGELITITAQTGVGKTHMAAQIARKACANGQHVLFCSGEMLAAHLMGRRMSVDAAVEYYKIRNPKSLTEHELFNLFEAAGVQCKKCHILDGELTLANIRNAAHSMKADLGCVIIDYDELVSVPGKNEWDQQATLVRTLKLLAMQRAVPVIVVSQMRKAIDAKDKHPTLDKIYGSGSKSKHASVVLYVERPFVQELTGSETDATIYVLKSRDGKQGRADCTFNTRTFRFEEKKEAEMYREGEYERNS